MQRSELWKSSKTEIACGAGLCSLTWAHSQLCCQSLCTALASRPCFSNLINCHHFNVVNMPTMRLLLSVGLERASHYQPYKLPLESQWVSPLGEDILPRSGSGQQHGKAGVTNGADETNLNFSIFNAYVYVHGVCVCAHMYTTVLVEARGPCWESYSVLSIHRSLRQLCSRAQSCLVQLV